MRNSTIALALSGFALSAAAPANPRFIDVKLVTQTSAPASGKTVLVGLQMTPQPGWHGYWSNPGENGLSPVVHWTAPPGVRFSPLEHPAPTMLQVSGLTSFVHDGPHMLIARMSVGRNLTIGTRLPITADVSFAACSDKLCVPEHAALKVDLVVGGGSPSTDAGGLRQAAAAIPKQASDGTFAIVGGNLLLELPPTLHLDSARARFFPDTNGYFDPVKAHAFTDDPIRISSPVHDPVPARVAGVLSDGSSSFRVAFRRGTVLASAKQQAPAIRENDTEIKPPLKARAARGAVAPAESATPEPLRATTANTEWLPFGAGLLTLFILIAGWSLRKSRR